MPYKASSFRNDFDRRVSTLRTQCNKANRKAADPDIRDLVFQCAILQTSAALETYIRLIVETMFFHVDNLNFMSLVPIKTRMLVVGKNIERHFSSLSYNREEGRFLDAMSGETAVFEITQNSCGNWSEFKPSIISSEVTYPSLKNIKKLLNRLGINDPLQQANKILRGDFETLITNFQALRTALAHEAPPQIAISDVRNRLSDMTRAVRVLDRILYLHVDRIFGARCWEKLC